MPENEPPTGTEPEFLGAFGMKLSKTQVPYFPGMEPPETAEDPPDQFDDDYWRWSYYRKPKLVGWLETEELSKRLQREADEEYAARRREIPAAEIAAEEERRARLRELVSLAIQTERPGDLARGRWDGCWKRSGMRGIVR